MKNLNFLTTLFFTTISLFYSCGGNGISTELKNEIESFEKEWQATGESAETFRSDLATDDSVCFSGSVKLNADSSMVAADKDYCKKNLDRYAEMKTLYDGFKAGWDKDSKDWSVFKNKAMKGEISSDEVSAELETWKKKLHSAEKNISEWNDELDKLRNSCVLPTIETEIKTDTSASVD